MIKILIRFGDLMLKGRNIRVFVNKLNENIKFKLKDLDVKIEKLHDRTIIHVDESIKDEVIKRLKRVPGIHSYSIIYIANKDIEDIIRVAKEMMLRDFNQENLRFKIEVKRSDKSYPMTSQEFTKMIAPKILSAVNIQYLIDVKNPEAILSIDIRRDGVYMHTKSHLLMGGFPGGIAGKAFVMTSGGIDSPVAAFLAIKQGVDVSLLHFESTPMTPLESVQKVIDLAKKLSVFMPKNKIKLHFVPFAKTHQALLMNVKDSYTITVMRRMMYRIGEMYAEKMGADILISGDSIGQVASQTLASLRVVEEVTRIPIIRPLATYDKQEIINIAHEIDTFDISIRPFNDCCSIYVPRNPVINPKSKDAEFYESKFDFMPLLNEAIENIITVDIDENTDFNVIDFGFDLKDAYENYLEEKNDNISTQ